MEARTVSKTQDAQTFFAWLVVRQVFTQTKNRFNYKNSRSILRSSKSTEIRMDILNVKLKET